MIFSEYGPNFHDLVFAGHYFPIGFVTKSMEPLQKLPIFCFSLRERLMKNFPLLSREVLPAFHFP